MTAKSISLRDIATPITGVIFDLDGTLLDSMPIWATIASDYLRSQDIQPEPGLDQHFMSLPQHTVYQAWRQIRHVIPDAFQPFRVREIVVNPLNPFLPLIPGLLAYVGIYQELFALSTHDAGHTG